MRAQYGLWITLFLLGSFVLVCASARECIPVPLPIAVMVALGMPAVFLLWQHRNKMGEMLGTTDNT